MEIILFTLFMIFNFLALVRVGKLTANGEDVLDTLENLVEGVTVLDIVLLVLGTLVGITVLLICIIAYIFVNFRDGKVYKVLTYKPFEIKEESEEE